MWIVTEIDPDVGRAKLLDVEVTALGHFWPLPIGFESLRPRGADSAQRGHRESFERCRAEGITISAAVAEWLPRPLLEYSQLATGRAPNFGDFACVCRLRLLDAFRFAQACA